MSVPPSNNQLEITIKRKTYRGVSGGLREVLRDFRLTIISGKVYAIIGPSGCGKTTLLRMIIGLDKDFDGTIGASPDLRIGMVFQEPRLLPWRSVFQNLRLAAPRARTEDIVRIAKDLGLSQHLDHFPGELSLGLARRVALARAFAVQPDLLVLDEPFVSLDAALAERLRNELVALVERTRTTTLLVTHDIDEAIRLADHIIILGDRPTRIVRSIEIKHPRTDMTDAYLADVRATLSKYLMPSPNHDIGHR